MNSLYRARNHRHIHAGIDGDFDGLLVIAVDLVDGVVIGNQETLEAQFLFQQSGQQALVARNLDAVPTAIGRHDGADAGADRRDVALQVNAPQGGLIDARVSLVEPAADRADDPERCAAVADEMLGARQHRERVGQIGGLEPAHRGTGQLAHHRRILRESFVSAAPADILRDCDAWREGPLNTGSANLLGGDSFHLFHQRCVARASQTDIVRKNHRAQNVVVPVYGVDAIEHRNPQTSPLGCCWIRS